MKKIVILLLSLLLALQLNAQTSLLQKKVSLHAKDITIIDALKMLRLKYGIQFSYSSNIIPANKKIQLYLKQVPLDIALRSIFQDTDIGYEVVGSQIVLRRVVMPKPQGRLSTRSKPTAQIKIPDPAPVFIETKTSLPPDSAKVDTTLEQVKLPHPELVLASVAKDSSTSEAKLDSAYQEARSKMRVKMNILRDSLRSKSKWTIHQLDLLFNDVEEELHQDYLRMRDSIRFKDKDFLPLPKWDSFSRRQQQDSLNPEYLHRKSQLTFIYPVGSNGIGAPYYINNFSVNIVAGYNGGVEGAELGGFANIVKSGVRGVQASGYLNAAGGDVSGMQAAGFMNLDGGKVSGLQAAGFMNLVRQSTNGLQAAGFINLNGTHSKGLQGAGFMNINGGRSIGTQAAGFMNVNRNSSKGIQGAGFMNINGESANGIQASGFMNYNHLGGKGIQGAGFANINGRGYFGTQAAGFMNLNADSSAGTQAAGFMNLNAKSSKGIQLAGFMNGQVNDLGGVQVAGFGNVCSGTLKGVQVSGFINVARKLHGTQIGVFNFADTIEKGIPVGVLSFVRKGGFKKLEVYASETFQANLAFKTGVRRFYNTLYLGYQQKKDYFRWAFGYGFGTEVRLGQKSYLDFDLLSMHVNENEEFTNYLNLNNRFQVSYGRQLTKGMAFFVGPNINYLISDYTNKDGSYGSKLPVFKLKEFGKFNDQLYWGVTAGLRFF